MILREIALEQNVRKGQNADNQQFLLIPKFCPPFPQQILILQLC